MCRGEAVTVGMSNCCTNVLLNWQQTMWLAYLPCYIKPLPCTANCPCHHPFSFGNPLQAFIDPREGLLQQIVFSNWFQARGTGKHCKGETFLKLLILRTFHELYSIQLWFFSVLNSYLVTCDTRLRFKWFYGCEFIHNNTKSYWNVRPCHDVQSFTTFLVILLPTTRKLWIWTSYIHTY